MTSQAMILTKRFGLFAADKQQTMADGKTYGGVKKIFELSRMHSSAIMFNGTADFQDVPIETLINEFKFQTNFRNISSIEEIKNEFINFLSKNTEASSNCDKYLQTFLKSFKDDLNSDIFHYGFDDAIDEKQRKKICPFIKKYSNYDDEFEEIIPNGKDKQKYTQILWEIFSFELKYEATGLIFAGFNQKSHYPSFFEVELYFNDNEKIIHEVIEYSIDSKEPIVKVFAINEQAYTFITGVNDEFIEFILQYISDSNESLIENVKWNLENEDIENIDELIEIIRKEQNKEYSDIAGDIHDFRLKALEDTTYSIENLPEWLLCLFADLLIKLTAVKQKTSSDIESVSMDTDILIMRKNSGFKWIMGNDGII